MVELRHASWSDRIAFRQPTAGQDERLHGRIHSCWGEPGMQAEQAKLTISAAQNQIGTAILKIDNRVLATALGRSSRPVEELPSHQL